VTSSAADEVAPRLIRARTVLLAALACATAAGALLALGLVSVPSPREVIDEAPETLGQWTYGFGALMAFLEFSSLLGVPLPFEAGAILSGAVAGEGEIEFVPLALGVWAGATAGEQINFWLGRRYGRPFLELYGPRYQVTPARLERLEAWFDRRGRLAVLVGRFIPLVRSTMPFVAGTSAMPFRTFAPLTVVGNAGWAGLFCGLGYVFYKSADEIADAVIDIGFAVLVLAVVAALALWIRARRRRRARQDA
jgi:membrane protein DedA with SNARE-associated domain